MFRKHTAPKPEGKNLTEPQRRAIETGAGVNEYQELIQDISRLSKIETSLLRTVAKSKIFISCSWSHSEKTTANYSQALEDVSIRDQILAKISSTGELNYLIGLTLAHVQHALRSQIPNATQVPVENLHIQSDILDNYIEKFWRDSADAVEKISNALKNPRWDFRTVSGIAKETGIDELSVSEILEDNSHLFRKSPVPDSSGKSLYTLVTRPVQWKERLAVLQNALRD